ncbi:MAG: GNAT family N-acetyltransferase [Cyanobacteria bacterium J06627_32]
MSKVHLRRVTKDNLEACLELRVSDDQQPCVATPEQSLAEAYVDPNLFPLAIYDVAACGYEQPDVPVIGFAMYEVVAGVGFIMRLLIDEKYQRQGYGRATVTEIVRRLRLHPGVEVIATSHVKENQAAAKLYGSMGFRSWNISYAVEHPTESYLKLEE